MRKPKSYHIYYSKEEKTNNQKITIGSYARDIANDVFIRMSDEEFMAKVHERMAMEEKDKAEQKRILPSSADFMDSDCSTKGTINVTALGSPPNSASIGASL